MGLVESLGVLVGEFAPHAITMWTDSKKDEAHRKRAALEAESISEMRTTMDKMPSSGHGDCPTCKLSTIKTELGPRTWKLLHGIPESLPDGELSPSVQKDVTRYVVAVLTNFPCHTCSMEMRSYVATHPVDASTRERLSRWLCNAHNEVNSRVGHEVISCKV